MKDKRNYGITLLMFFVCLVWTPAAFADFSGKVVAVKDGDTLEVMKEGFAVRVRLYGIDCPEKGQAFGRRAKHFTSDLAFRKMIEVKERGTDRYGRTIGEVILNDGRSLNRELVRAGLAWWYRRYARTDVTLEALEREAREARIGLWSDANPVPPWEWRKERRAR